MSTLSRWLAFAALLALASVQNAAPSAPDAVETCRALVDSEGLRDESPVATPLEQRSRRHSEFTLCDREPTEGEGDDLSRAALPAEKPTFGFKPPLGLRCQALEWVARQKKSSVRPDAPRGPPSTLR